MPILPLSANLPRPVAQAASIIGLLWRWLQAFIYRARRFLGQRRLHSHAINSLQGVSPEVLRDIGAAPELIAELQAADQIRQGQLGRPQHW